MVTRKLEGHQSALIERFTSPRPGPLAERINRACYDALITTATDRSALARAFVELGSLSPPRATTRYCAEGLRALGALGIEAALNGIDATDAGPMRLRRARLAARAAQSRLPQSAAFWKTAPPEDIARVIAEWRLQLAARKLIDPPPDVDTNALPAADSNGLPPLPDGAEPDEDAATGGLP